MKVDSDSGDASEPIVTSRLNENSSTLTDQTKSVLEHESLDDKIDKMYQDLGGFSKFQFFAVFALLLGHSGQNFQFMIIGYLTQAPNSFVCAYADPNDQPPCTKENICAYDPRITSWKADPDSSMTLYNWQH